VHTEYELSYEDYKNAHSLYLKRRPISLAFHIVFYWLLPLALLGVFVFYLKELLRHNGVVAASILHSLLPLAGYSLVLICLRQFSLRRNYRIMFPKGYAKPGYILVRRAAMCIGDSWKKRGKDLLVGDYEGCAE
jgi:hypothetical protein